VTAVAMMIVVNLPLLGLLSFFAALIDGFDVIVENGGDDGDHVGLDDASADIFGASDADIDNTLEGKIPFPHSHHVLTATLLEDADEPLDAAINGENITDAS
jgi:hypothetical protein